jgi:hypothetical protein
MRFFWGACLILLTVLPAAGEAGVYPEAIPVVRIIPDDFPVDAAFFFPSGTPIERFTGRRGAWYALYRVRLDPGAPYEVVLGHTGDPARMRLFAMDNHPFDQVSVKMELRISKVDMWHHSERKFYSSMISLPRNAAIDSLYLLLEWNPPAGKDRPIPLVIQVLSIDPYEIEYRRARERHGDKVKSPIQSQAPPVYEIPVPRVNPRERMPAEPVPPRPDWR